MTKQGEAPGHPEQARAAAEAMRDVLGSALLAVYLYGSAVSGLRPRSDLDLLAVIDRPMTDTDRQTLLAAFLRLSARHPAPPRGPRCLDVIVFLTAELAAPDAAARAEFIYGEWLRETFEAGDVPSPVADPENTLVVAQARGEAQPIYGPPATRLLPEIPPEQVRGAMRAALPALLEGLRGDERNVLLTLARMWRTAATGEFVDKDAAAAWAARQLPVRTARTLEYARKGYRGEVDDDWRGRRGEARRAAGCLHRRVVELT